jgi:hypothetical protein
MTLRIPLGLGERDERALSAIESAVVAEKAASLGIAGQRLERALTALREGEGGREALLEAAAERAWAFLVQRELCGLRDREQAIADYAIPKEVLARMGASPPPERDLKGEKTCGDG